MEAALHRTTCCRYFSWHATKTNKPRQTMITVLDKPVVKGVFPNGDLDFDFSHITNWLTSEDDNQRTPLVVDMVYEGVQDIFVLQVLAEYLKDARATGGLGCTVLAVDFFPYSQMDRPMRGHEPTLKFVARLFNSMGFSRVFVNDPHSDVTPMLVDRCVPVYPTIGGYVGPALVTGKYDLVVYPDAGAAKKYGSLVTDLLRFMQEEGNAPDMPKIFTASGTKSRDLESGDIVTYDVQLPAGIDFTGKRVLIVDDLVMGGRTFKVLAAILKDRYHVGPIDLVVSHTVPGTSDAFIQSKGDGMFNAIITTEDIDDEQ